jgi:hypothetical protein
MSRLEIKPDGTIERGIFTSWKPWDWIANAYLRTQDAAHDNQATEEWRDKMDSLSHQDPGSTDLGHNFYHAAADTNEQAQEQARNGDYIGAAATLLGSPVTAGADAASTTVKNDFNREGGWFRYTLAAIGGLFGSSLGSIIGKIPGVGFTGSLIGVVGGGALAAFAGYHFAPKISGYFGFSGGGAESDTKSQDEPETSPVASLDTRMNEVTGENPVIGRITPETVAAAKAGPATPAPHAATEWHHTAA